MNFSIPRWLNCRQLILGGSAVAVSRLRMSVLRSACRAVREGRLDDARQSIAQEGDAADSDAWCLNLLGILAVLRGDWPVAARCWRRALVVDRNCVPARHNIRRYFELFQFGHSNEPFLLGDEPECSMNGNET